MTKQAIIDKLRDPQEKEVALTEQETLYIIQEWINNHFGRPTVADDLRTYTYFENTTVSALPSKLRHGVKIKTK